MKTKYNDGIHQITNEQYHAADGLSRSQLMLFDKSPYHFWYEVYSGKAEKKETTPAMLLGSLFHTLLLEPDLFAEHYAISPKIDRRTTKGKEEYQIFMDENKDKILLTDEQYSKVCVMVEHIKQHEIVSTLVDGAVFEQSIFWTDKETGLQFKVRPDIWASKMVVDLKTTNDSNPVSFSRSALNYGYFLQAGMIFEACQSLGKPIDMFVFLVAEKEAPYVPAALILNDEAIQYGIKQFAKYKNKLKQCLDANKWPGYQIQELSLPGYVKTDDMEQVA